MKLSEQAEEARRAYHKQWRAKNPDKVRANQARYWERKAERAAEEADAAGKLHYSFADLRKLQAKRRAIEDASPELESVNIEPGELIPGEIIAGEIEPAEKSDILRAR